MAEQGIVRIRTGLAAGVALALSVHAQEAAESVHLDELVITATRTEASVRTLGSSVTVISAQELENARVDTVLDALRLVPGVDVVQSGGPGRVTSVFVRGHNSAHTRVLMDGVRINSNAGGGYDFADIPVCNIERIEIVRGAQSALYGSDAIGGVINIVTKRGEGGMTGSAEAAIGTKGYRQGGLALSGGNERGDYSIGYNYRRFLGTTVASEDLGNTENDEWENTTVSSRFGLNFLDDGRADLILGYSDDMTETDGFVWPNPTDDPNYVQQRDSFTGKLELSKSFTDWYRQKLSIGYAREDFTGEDPDTPVNVFQIVSQTLDASVKADFFPFAGDTLSVGYDHERQEARNRSNNIAEGLDLHSVFIQNHWAHGDSLSATVGVRHDNHETFGEETTFRLALSGRVPAVGTRLHASYGSGFRAPTINDLYWPNTAFALGNPNLDPETSISFDFGVEQSLLDERIVVDVTYFQSEVEDLIQWAATGPNWFDPWSPQNVAEAEIDGIETTLRLRPIKGLDLQASHTYTNHQDTTTGNELARRPKHRFTASANYFFLERVNINLSAVRVGTRYDDAGNATELQAYTRVDLAAHCDVTENLRVFGRIENLFDEEYEEAKDFDIAGQYILAGVKLSF